MSLFLIFLFAVTLAYDESVLKTASGERIVGELVRLDETGLLFRQKNRSESGAFRFEQLATIHFQGEPVSEPGENTFSAIRLIDSSLVLASSFEVKDGLGVAILASGITLHIERRNLAFVQFKIPSGGPLATQWEDLTKSSLTSGDALVIQRNGRYELLEGMVGNISFERVQFEMDDRSAQIKRDKIDGVMFYHASGRKLAKPICHITLRNRSSLVVRTLSIEDDSIRCTAVSGSEWLIPLALISTMDFEIGRAVRLGDVLPTSRDWTPLIASSNIINKLRSLKLPRNNRSYDNRQLELRIQSTEGDIQIRSFDSGYAMVGGTKLAFSLNGDYEILTGVVGFSPRSGDGGDLVLRIRGDNGVLLERRLEKASYTHAFQIELDISDVDRLVIEVDYHDNRAVGDMIHLCDLEVSR